MTYFYSESTGGFYLESEHSGNMPSDAVPISDAARQSILDTPRENKTVPPSVTMRQARLALLDSGLLDDVVAAANKDPRCAIEFEYAQTVERNSPWVMQIGATLNLDLDALFIAAAKL